MPQPLNDRREFARYDTNVSALLMTRDMRLGVRMLSVSAGGAMVRMDRLSSKVFEGEEFVIEITGIGKFPAIKKWRRDTDIGAGFILSDADRLRLADRLADRFGPRRSSLSRLAANSSQP